MFPAPAPWPIGALPCWPAPSAHGLPLRIAPPAPRKPLSHGPNPTRHHRLCHNGAGHLARMLNKSPENPTNRLPDFMDDASMTALMPLLQTKLEPVSPSASAGSSASAGAMAASRGRSPAADSLGEFHRALAAAHATGPVSASTADPASRRQLADSPARQGAAAKPGKASPANGKSLPDSACTGTTQPQTTADNLSADPKARLADQSNDTGTGQPTNTSADDDRSAQLLAGAAAMATLATPAGPAISHAMSGGSAASGQAASDPLKAPQANLAADARAKARANSVSRAAPLANRPDPAAARQTDPDPQGDNFGHGAVSPPLKGVTQPNQAGGTTALPVLPMLSTMAAAGKPEPHTPVTAPSGISFGISSGTLGAEQVRLTLAASPLRLRDTPALPGGPVISMRATNQTTAPEPPLAPAEPSAIQAATAQNGQAAGGQANEDSAAIATRRHGADESQNPPLAAPAAPNPPAPHLAGSLAPAPSPDAGPAMPHDYAALVDRLVEARAAARGSTPAGGVQAAVNHADFGQVSLRFSADANGMSVSMASRDPGFAPAVQAALAAAAAATQAGAQPDGQNDAQARHSGPQNPPHSGRDLIQSDTFEQAAGRSDQQTGQRGGSTFGAGQNRHLPQPTTTPGSSAPTPAGLARPSGIFA